VTHGHPVALLGACFHALALFDSLKKGQIAGPDAWPGYLDCMKAVPNWVATDPELSTMWLPSWEREAGGQFAAAWENALVDFGKQFSVAAKAVTCSGSSESKERVYRDLIANLGCFDARLRGSGTLTSLLSSGLAFMFRDDPHSAIVLAANALQSDTDTIATMAGALIGAVHPSPPPEPVLDQEYLVEQARRIAVIQAKGAVSNHPYPDLAIWSPPRSGVDAVVVDDKGAFFLRGMGTMSPFGEVLKQGNAKDALWRMFTLPWKQTVIVRYRPDPSRMTNADRPVAVPLPSPTFQRDVRVQPQPRIRRISAVSRSAAEQALLSFEQTKKSGAPPRTAKEPATASLGNSEMLPALPNLPRNQTRSPTRVENIFERLKREGFPAEGIGRALTDFVSFPDGVELSAALGVDIYKALRKAKPTPSDAQSQTIDQRTDEVIRGAFAYELMGRHFLDLAVCDSAGHVVAYAAIVVKAMIVRVKKARAAGVAAGNSNLRTPSP